jgi:hypothetical protein
MGTPHERKGTQIINLSPLLIYELYNKPYKSKTKKKKTLKRHGKRYTKYGAVIEKPAH